MIDQEVASDVTTVPRGIDFSRIKAGKLVSVNGYRFEAEVQTGYVRISGEKGGGMEAKCDDGVLEFNIFTRIQATDSHYQDLYAGEFVAAIIDRFGREGLPIDEIRSLWESGSDNNTQFFEVYRGSDTRARSANRTWSGKTFGKHGFAVRSNDDVLVVPLVKNVIAHFKK